MGVALRQLGRGVLLASILMGGCVHGFRNPGPRGFADIRGPQRIPAGVLGRESGVRGVAKPFVQPESPRPVVPPAPSEHSWEEPSLVRPAIAWEDSATRRAIFPTAGVFDKPAEAVKQGVNKVAEAIAPTPHVTPADDPTLLSTKAKPTPELHLSIAKYHEESGRPAAADQSYQQALRMAPKHLGAHLEYARFKERQGETREAILWCQRAARLYPNEAAVFNDLGLICAKHGIHADALAAYRRAIELQPRRALYRNNIAVLLVEMGQADQALQHLTAVYSDAEAYYKLGYLLQAKGEVHRAIGAFSQALALNPSMREAGIWLQHLQAEQATAAGASHRPWNAFATSPAPFSEEPSVWDRPGGEPIGATTRGTGGDTPAARVGARPSPPLRHPSPETPVQRLPKAEPMPRPDGPVTWPRRLPQVSPEKPVGLIQPRHDLAPATRTLALTTEEPSEAPLPTDGSSATVAR